MTTRVKTAFAAPSPGEILKKQAQHATARRSSAAADTGIDVACNPFQPNMHIEALTERGVLLAPLLVQWRYHVGAAKPFAKWLRTKDIILSKARLGINANTDGVHYFGTYIVQEDILPDSDDGTASPPGPPVACQTLWGFTSEEAMVHMFDLCRGRIERVSIVETDLRDFIIGLKKHIREAGVEHFDQSVMVAPAAL
jgi:hypothetical protein